MWNYRLVGRRTPIPDDPDLCCWGIHEVYYDDDHNIEHWTEDPQDVFGLSPEEARSTYDMMAEAFTTPPLIEVKLDGELKLVFYQKEVDNEQI